MYLVIPTHPYFFWVVSHHSRTLPPKESEQDPKNRLSLLPTARPCPFLPLTHDSLLLYWLVVFGPCACSSSVYVQSVFTAHAFAMVWRLVCAFCRLSLTSYGVDCFLISHSLRLASFKGWFLLDCGLFSLQPTLCSFRSHTTITATLLCYSCCGVI